MRKHYTLFVILLCVCLTGAAQSYTEGNDLSNILPATDTFVFQNAGIQIQGQMNTPSDGGDWFVIDLPSGCQISGVAYKIIDPSSVGITGHFQFGTNNQQSYSGPTSSVFANAGQNPTQAFPKVGPAKIVCGAVANIAFQSDWVMGFTGSCTPCANPSMPQVSASPAAMCTAGTPVTLNISGTLGDAKGWVIYKDSCGGILVGDTSGTTFVVNPSVTTTYYIRGEGGCVTPGACAAVQVVVGDSTPPTILCPGDVTVKLETSCEHTLQSYDWAVTISDNCDANPTLAQSPPSGAVIIGDTTVTFTGTDSTGNSVTCTFQVFVEDTGATLDTSVTQSGATLTSNATNVSYQWVDCGSNYSAITGDTGSTCNTALSQNGNYAVIITRKGCVDTSSCYNVNVVSIYRLASFEASVYPNPAIDLLHLRFPTRLTGIATFQNVQGKKILKMGFADRDVDIPVSGIAPGMYYLLINVGGERLQKKIMIGQ